MANLPKFDVEHALSMYATSFVLMPAEGIYDEAVVGQFKNNLATCHIYVIGQMPKIELCDVRKDAGELVCSFEVAGVLKTLRWPMPAGAKVEGSGGADGWVVVMPDGRRMFPRTDAVARRLNRELDVMPFEVLYIGQAYGADGTRNALDRLKKHETLQKIAVQGIPATHRLTLLLLEIAPNRIITAFNPKAKQQDQSSERIAHGLDKLFDTSEAERVALFEAALIRYFQPSFNTRLKDSFPSTNMKMLADCYAKDFNALIAEVCIDELPFKMFTANAERAQYHTAFFADIPQVASELSETTTSVGR
jgi:hypothetical protein